VQIKTRSRLAILAACAVASAGLAACGNSEEAEQIQQQASELQQKAGKMAEEVQSGQRDAVEAAEEIQRDSVELADDMIDDAQSDPNVPDEVKDQLEAAQEQVHTELGQ
jgi:outer membrane murein-binding lipoprotein Lpp